MTSALFINGIYESVLLEILSAQEVRGGGFSYLQPHKGQVIALLRREDPSTSNPIRLYASTTANLSSICYTAEIVGWKDKRELLGHQSVEIRKHLLEWQQDELDLFDGAQEGAAQAINIIIIQNLKRLETVYSTGLLTKRSDGLPLKKRTRPGGWSEVNCFDDLLSLPIETRSHIDSCLTSQIADSLNLPDSERARRLQKAQRYAERVQIISIGYRRNADVIAAVLLRANGNCERCKANAPFTRRSDGSPYLEVHHWKPLSDGGPDIVDNAGALCPNCHREVHHA
ncbi:HNH endonuclease [Synechococcus sp. BO 8801]|uniref:HNH endonuclease n=1 Tax=Synechococcus sp. BO 8801 TaxID=169670 RepID=UPI000B986310|nr:HNH endonuclease [Synechococcus sp. BO 8801]